MDRKIIRNVSKEQLVRDADDIIRDLKKELAKCEGERDMVQICFDKLLHEGAEAFLRHIREREDLNPRS